jgi:four helix bundle protein
MQKAEGRKDIRERAFEFACRIVRLHRVATRNATSRPILLQLLRAGTSIGANLEEADAGQSKADFISKNRIALKESRETLYWLRPIAATGIVKPTRIADLTIEANEIVSILTAIVRNASRTSQR